MLLVSFSWTWPAVIADAKTVTRRGWDGTYPAMFRPGRSFVAYDYLPRVRRSLSAFGLAPERIAMCEVASITYEPAILMPPEDYVGEGFAYLRRLAHAAIRGEAEWPALPEKGRLLTPQEILLRTQVEGFERWQMSPEWSWVLRFRIREIFKTPDPSWPSASFAETTRPSHSGSKMSMRRFAKIAGKDSALLLAR